VALSLIFAVMLLLAAFMCIRMAGAQLSMRNGIGTGVVIGVVIGVAAVLVSELCLPILSSLGI
jgi:hypothetical protein